MIRDCVRESVYWAGVLLRQRGQQDYNWTMSRRSRLRVTAKALLMLAVGGLWRDRLDRPPQARKLDGFTYTWPTDAVQVAVGEVHKGSHPEWGETGNFDYLAVPYRGWALRVGSDGWP